jgi:D-3-phosphoglycerate dehydrogenase
MTSAAHERASERAAEAAESFEADIVVMIQGDEPLVTPAMIEASVAPMLADPSVACVNLARRIGSLEEYLDRNTIKVVTDARGDALYFSRAPIPSADFTRNSSSDFTRDLSGDSACGTSASSGAGVSSLAGVPVFKQVCVIPFRRECLREFARLPPTPLERAESIDMLRLVEHGLPVRMVETEEETHAVDTPEDLRRVERMMRNDPLLRRYVEPVGGEENRRAVGDEGQRMKWRVLITAPYMLASVGEFRARLSAEGLEVLTAEVRERLSEEDLLPLVGEVDGVICGDDRFTERVLRAAPRLKVISKWGTGVDSIDTAAAARLGIRVRNTPDAFTDCVADTALGYVLCFARKLTQMDADVRRGLWVKPEAVSLRECTLGVIGVGNIGRAVVRRARAFGMRVLGNDPVTPPASFVEETGLGLSSLRELLAESDFVSLHCDLNPTSFHLLGRDALALMRPTAYLVNTSRGPVVDEAALIDALGERRIAGAALDVFEVEPLSACSPLRALPNCLLAPHNANSGHAARLRVHESTIANLLDALREAG